MTKNQIIEQLQKMPENSRVIWMLEKIEEIRNDFETAQDLLEHKVYKFVDDFLTNGVNVPKDMRKYIAIGKRYEDFIDMFKCRVRMSEGLLSEDAREMLLMARSEIKKLRGQIAGTKAETQDFKADMKNMARKIYIYEQVNKLPTATQKKALTLCEGAKSK